MMDEVRVLTTQADIEAALERASNEPDLPRARSAQYLRDLDILILQIDNGHRLVIPREHVEELQNATKDQLSKIEIFSGLDIAWPELDFDLYLPYLLEGRYGSEKWMKSLEESLVAA